MKKNKQKLTAVWEIISAAEYVDGLDRDVNNDDLIKIYNGQFVPLLLSNRVERKQIWSISIKTIARDDDGAVHEHEMEWLFDKPMSLVEVISGSPHIRFNYGGMKLRWQGVSKQWIDVVDTDLKGLTAVSALATASCMGYVKQMNTNFLMNRIMSMSN